MQLQLLPYKVQYWIGKLEQQEKQAGYQSVEQWYKNKVSQLHWRQKPFLDFAWEYFNYKRNLWYPPTAAKLIPYL